MELLILEIISMAVADSWSRANMGELGIGTADLWFEVSMDFEEIQ